MLRDINDRELADEKTIRQYAKGEQQERELQQELEFYAKDANCARMPMKVSRIMAGQRNRTPAKAVNGVNTLTPRLNNNARKPTSGRNTSRNHLFSGLRHRQLSGVENEKAQHQHADQTGPTRRQHGRNAGTAIDPRFEQHWHNQPQPGDTKPEPPRPETAT